MESDVVDVDRRGFLGTGSRAMLLLAGSGRARIPCEPGEVVGGSCVARVRWDTITSLLRVVWLILSAKSRGLPAKFRQLPPCFVPLFLLELPPFPQIVRPFANGYAFYRRRYALCRWFAFFSQGFPRATPPHALTEGRGHFGMRVGDEYASLGGCWG